jgi:hypothetical protein
VDEQKEAWYSLQNGSRFLRRTGDSLAATCWRAQLKCDKSRLTGPGGMPSVSKKRGACEHLCRITSFVREMQIIQVSFHRRTDRTRRSVMAMCGFCSGTGHVTCPGCGGRGYKGRLTMNGEYDQSPCAVCAGRRHINCQVCHGRGQIDTPTPVVGRVPGRKKKKS